MANSFPFPTDEEISVVDKLYNQLFDIKCEHNIVDLVASSKYQLTKTCVLRFYRGRKCVEETCLRAVRRHIQWRNDNDVDRIKDKLHLFKTELDSGKIVTKGKDLFGRPVIFIYAGKHNKYKRSLEELKMLIIYTIEDTLKRSLPHEERLMISFDLSGFSLSCMDYEIVRLLIDILQYNYPETMNSALIVNSPFLFHACWAVIRPWLDPITASKVVFINQKQLAEHVVLSIDAVEKEEGETEDASSSIISIDLSSVEGTQKEGIPTTAAVTSGSSSTVDSESDHGELGHSESGHSTGLSS